MNVRSTLVWVDEEFPLPSIFWPSIVSDVSNRATHVHPMRVLSNKVKQSVHERVCISTYTCLVDPRNAAAYPASSQDPRAIFFFFFFLLNYCLRGIAYIRHHFSKLGNRAPMPSNLRVTACIADGIRHAIPGLYKASHTL